MKMTTVSRQIEINAPADEVWGAIADFGGVYKWAPNVTSSYSTTEANGGVGAGRHCEVPGFGGIDEEIVEWKEGHSYKYQVENIGPIGKLVNEWSVTSHGNKSVVTTNVSYRMRFGIMGALMDKLMVRRSIRKAMAQAQDGLKGYVETREPIAMATPVGTAEKAV